MKNLLKCGTGSYRKAALSVAVIDTIFAGILLFLFLLGSSVLIAFEFVGGTQNATRALDEITDGVLGQEQTNYTDIRQSKDVAEDMGIYLIFMYLAIVDFVISYIFLNGVKSKNLTNWQILLGVRITIICTFIIVFILNISNGISWQRSTAEVFFALYRICALLIGYSYFKELKVSCCESCNSPVEKQTNWGDKRLSVISIGHKRKDIKKGIKLEVPSVCLSDDCGRVTPIFTVPSAATPAWSIFHMEKMRT